MCNTRALSALLAILTALIQGCGLIAREGPDYRGERGRDQALGVLANAAKAAAPVSPPAPAEGQVDAARIGGIDVLAANQPDVYLIKNAAIAIESDDARAAANQLIQSLQPVGGYVSNLNEYVDALGKRTITLQVRVPADKFDQSISSLEALGRVLNKQVGTEDVTEEYIDTDSRARNLKKTEERLIDHLNRAAKLEDILRVENELTRVREQIERMEGRLRFLKNRVAFSTIGVTLQEAAKAGPIVPPQSFSTAKEFSEALRSLVAFLQGLWSKTIWVIVWLPVYAVAIIAAYGAYRLLRRRALR